MYIRWTEHLKTEEEKERFQNSIYSAKIVLERLKDIIEEDEQTLDRSETDERVYETPNWDYRQAHKNGMRKYLNTIKKLIDLDQQKGTINDR